jgi:deoxyadenosine/deoxycytidine kinase
MFISVVGNIGVGKSTLTKLISERMKFKLFEEDAENSILIKFYEDIENNVKPSEYAFLLQKFFMFSRAASHMDIQASGADCVQERIIHEDREVFAVHLNKKGFISDEKFEEYTKNFEICSKDLETPELLIYLKAPTSILRERIRERGRDSEKQLLDESNPYLEELEVLYGKMIGNFSSKILVINSEEYDFCDNLEDQEQVLELIKESLK